MTRIVESQITILVAEDDNFQRLALIDVLELCDYKGIFAHFSSPFLTCFFKLLRSRMEN